jgi:uncharacterized membrane protein
MTRPRQRPVDPPRFGRDTQAFSRVVNLSDAVFAIAMTLLVLTLDVPTTEVHRLREALVDQLPQFIAFALSFALVANLWWQHHRMLDLLQAIEPAVIGINLILLAFVALVPYPTSLLGVAPDDSTAVIVFLAVFVVLTLLHLALLARAGALRLVREDVPRERYIGLLAGYGVGVLVLLVAMLIALWSAPVALVVVGASIILGPLGARRPERFLRLDTPASPRQSEPRPPKPPRR